MHRTVHPQGNAVAPQEVGHQVGEGPILAHRHSLSTNTVILGGRGGTAGDGHIHVAIKGNGIAGGGRASYRVARSLQHPLTRIVIQVLIAGHGAVGRDPGGETALIVVGHDGPTLSSITTVTRGRIDVAAGHVTHSIVAGILVGNAAQRDRSVCREAAIGFTA
ncbi:hypothetical protein [Dictyobacter kobayashii]|uniref:hypothetical protein n=1 Tax=Dictyobacter kobayashii TaxID=2014872 RepID=UPI00138668E5|nr:hypothetical protein [Dictyobacter kobayashii]